jgi:glucokinase
MKNYGLVADVGGTNIRFGVVDLRHPRDLSVRSVRKLATKDYANIIDAARFYFADLKPESPPSSVVFAVAGPIQREREISFTNSHWHFTVSQLRTALGVERIKLINDYEAIAAAVPSLEPQDMVTVGPTVPHSGASKERETIAIVGPGTGLGVAGFVRSRDETVPLVTEGGHVNFAPSDALEIEILKILSRQFEHVSAERILSGPGLSALHAAMAEIEGSARETLTPEEITTAAKSDMSSFSGKVFSRFCAILGAFAGDVALTMGARDGLLIAGGILPTIADAFAASPFRERFEAKGRFQAYMKAIPTRLIVQQHVGLIGAASVLLAEKAAPASKAVAAC